MRQGCTPVSPAGKACAQEGWQLACCGHKLSHSLLCGAVRGEPEQAGMGQLRHRVGELVNQGLTYVLHGQIFLTLAGPCASLSMSLLGARSPG